MVPFLTAEAQYWFSVSNFNFSWNWVNPDTPTPTVGSENYTGFVSTGIGLTGGLHFGLWSGVTASAGSRKDFAFGVRVDVLESTILLLMGLGLADIGDQRKRKFTALLTKGPTTSPLWFALAGFSLALNDGFWPVSV